MTLEKISYDQLPMKRRTYPNAAFAEKCLDDFLKLKCDAVKITGWPIPRDSKTLRSAMTTAIKKKNVSARVKAHADEKFVYLSLVR